MSRPIIFTSEAVTEGHPDKVADYISDSVLDACLEVRPDARVACETLVKGDRVVLAGEISVPLDEIRLDKVVRSAIGRAGYFHADVPFNAKDVTIQTLLTEQSAQIGAAVGSGSDLGAGDQGIMFGYATDETPELMPLPILLAQRLAKRLTNARTWGRTRWLRSDGKTQVSVEYVDGRPVRVTDVLVSSQHTPGALEALRRYVTEHLLTSALGSWYNPEMRVLVNPAGEWTLGGPMVDAGLTGRKIIADTYGGMARHGGGAFSGKDPSKVDRSGAYFCRWLARQVVERGLAQRAEIQVSYAIGQAKPVSVYVDTFGTGDDRAAEELVASHDFRPAAIIEWLGLDQPIYRETTNYGHFGREGLPWEWGVKVQKPVGERAGQIGARESLRVTSPMPLISREPEVAGEQGHDMHPEYFKTRFRVDCEVSDWPKEFVIVSAHATTGETWSKKENKRARKKLAAELEQLAYWSEEITGFSPETGHSERSFATLIDLDAACNLGLHFKQDAIYHVKGDVLSVTYCDHRRKLVVVGPFRERVGLSRYGSEPELRLDAGPEGPWHSVTVDHFISVLDRQLVAADDGLDKGSGSVLVPQDQIFAIRALLDAFPDDESRAQAREDLDWEVVAMEDLADLFPEMGNLESVIRCEVTDSRTSGTWGLDQFTLGNRGYLYHHSEYCGVEEAITVRGAWEGVDDAEARRACILSVYARQWGRLGLPPSLGQWVWGDPEILQTGVSRALAEDGSERTWKRVFDAINGANGFSSPALEDVVVIAKRAGIAGLVLGRVMASLGDSQFVERIVGGGATEAERAAITGLLLHRMGLR